MDIIKLLSIQKEDKQKWVKYYELETYKYYDYIINYQNQKWFKSNCDSLPKLEYSRMLKFFVK